MRLLGAVTVFLTAAALIGAGVVLAVNGQPWLLAASVLAFFAGFIRFGCLQP